MQIKIKEQYKTNRRIVIAGLTRNRKRFINQASAIAGQARNDSTFINI